MPSTAGSLDGATEDKNRPSVARCSTAGRVGKLRAGSKRTEPPPRCGVLLGTVRVLSSSALLAASLACAPVATTPAPTAEPGTKTETETARPHQAPTPWRAVVAKAELPDITSATRLQGRRRSGQECLGGWKVETTEGEVFIDDRLGIRWGPVLLEAWPPHDLVPRDAYLGMPRPLTSHV